MKKFLNQTWVTNVLLSSIITMLLAWGGSLELRKADRAVNDVVHASILKEIGEVNDGVQRIEDKIDKLHLYKTELAEVPAYPILMQVTKPFDPNRVPTERITRNDKALH